jgi:hypothetical protein
MSQTRASLIEKLESLETKVLGTVHTTTDTVSRTVEDVGTTVRESTQDVRSTVQEALASVRDAFDLSRQMHQHPWLLFGSSIFAGYVSGRVLDGLERGRLPSLPTLSAQPEQLLPRDSELRERIQVEPPARRTTSTWLKALADTFAPELDKLKRTAVGMALGLMRDRLTESVPPQMRTQFTDLMDRVAVKLGGEPPPPGTLASHGTEAEEHNGSERVRSMGLG